nr:GGDEF domain-containing protein [Cohnella kolymensis]
MNRKNEALHERNMELIAIQDELFRVNQKLEQMAITDGLTGCFNRRYLMQQLEHEVLLNMRYRIPYSILLFDIDHFKQINDHYGHLVGDEVIRSTVNIVRDTLRRPIYSRVTAERNLRFTYLIRVASKRIFWPIASCTPSPITVWIRVRNKSM